MGTPTHINKLALIYCTAETQLAVKDIEGDFKLIRLDIKSGNELIMQRFPNFEIDSTLQAVEIREN